MTSNYTPAQPAAQYRGDRAKELEAINKRQADLIYELRAELHEAQEAVTYWRELCARKDELIRSLIFWTAGITAGALVAIVAAIKW